ncbi:MAG: 50S ribosomal protein L21 [Patescibacteria group bacterium]|jgi:large subunit ribosomal protein L21|nr:50S ribosomal protein L21 [Patescibacteria group bacterium]MDD5172568.1 50S ribosomal protein L21 [Patescibacteria group bacterium]
MCKFMSLMAVIRTGGKQYLVKEGDVLRVEKLDKKAGNKISFKDVLLCFDPQKKTGVEIGKPALKIKVEGEVLAEEKGRKVSVIKYKPKVRYHRNVGHRQWQTKVKILSIMEEKKSTEPAAEKKIKK